jgi:D-amino peptidase
MKAFISADMEGITGIAAPEDVVRDEPEYERGVDLLHADVNAAVEGAVAGGAETVLVNDSHSSMRNLDRERLDDRATLIRGNTKPRSMMQGLTEEFDVALFVGYHAKAGTAEAVLNHTFFGHALQALYVDGTEVGEMGWNARLAGSLGIPVGLVTGDDATVAEARDELTDPEVVEVKQAIDRFSARCRPTAETGPEITEASRRAVERADNGDLSPVQVPEPVEIAAAWATTNHAASAAGMPGVERQGGRRTAVTAETYPEAFEATVGMLRAGGAGTNEYYG